MEGVLVWSALVEGLSQGSERRVWGRHQGRQWPISGRIDGVVDEEKKRLVNEGKRVTPPPRRQRGDLWAYREGRPIPDRAPTGSGHRLGARRSFRGAGLVIRLGVPSIGIVLVKTCFLTLYSTSKTAARDVRFLLPGRMSQLHPDMPSQTDPLSSLTPLSPNISVFYPPPTTPLSPTSTTPPPKLIILAPWHSASPTPIATHLLAPHRALFPTTPILLVRTPRRHLLLPSLAFRELAAFAVPVVRAVCPSTTTPRGDPDLLIHVFSAGGCAALAHLRTLLAPHMPAHTVVFDSGPPRSAQRALLWSSTTRFFWPAWFWGLVLSVWLWVVGRVGGVARRQQAGVHNERGGRARAEVRRTYVYSRGDGVVGWREVEGHAEEARRRGFEVRMERFEGTGHVGHGRGDMGRYWGAVRGAWEGAMGGGG